ncbi:HAD family hydrolase [Solwaraspora sp. WMMB335]|uniref:HAD family hydrolase n=1 Tax=Solwaraspora sp. WMMB335 TaxID=3404118 RepID=UPI003B942E61
MLFDMDGTLIDSEKLWDVALQELAARYGGQLSPTARLAMVGSDLATTMRLLHGDLDQPWRDPVSGAAWLTARVTELFWTDIQWRPGAAELLREVRRAGVPTALVTSTERGLVDVALATLGRHNFDVVVCGDEVAATKPDPAPYLAAVAALGVPVAACVAIEDSPAGVASAHTAGVTVLAVPDGARLAVPAGVTVRSSLTGVSLSMLGMLAAASGGGQHAGSGRPTG